MKTSRICLLTSIFLLGVCSCSPKNKPRQVHEEERRWTPNETPLDTSVEAASFDQVDLQKFYSLLKTSKQKDLTNSILIPLSSYVLNAKFIEAPRYRTSRMTQMIQIFHEAFLEVLESDNKSENFIKLKSAYYKTVLAGCSADLKRDCINVDIFSKVARFTRIMTLLAEELDGPLEAELRTHDTPTLCIEKSQNCRSLIEERYRRLAVASLNKSMHDDPIFSFAYMKYARTFAALINHSKKDRLDSLGYISEVHGKIFETVIARYTPKSQTDPDFRKFVENFNPWGFSQKKSDTFQYGTKIMFKFGSECCLYKNQEQTQVSDAVKAAIIESQKEADTFGPSFHQMVKAIQLRYGNSLFTNLGMAKEISLVENLNSGFYNEFFLVTDRLFRGHLGVPEIEMVLRNTPLTRTRTELPKLIATYIKVYLVHMLVETNDFMSSIYKSKISSDKVFEEATTRSREIATRWYHVQTQIDLLERVMTSYFRGQNLTSTEYVEVTKLIKAVNRNIHYFSVDPSRIKIVYFLSKMQGEIVINTWFGRIKVVAGEVLKDLFDGLLTSSEDIWFPFGKNNEPMDRQMLLYGWHYMLSTKSLEGIDRPKFFELIFTKYVEGDLDKLRTKVSTFERDTLGHHGYSTLEAICDYELENKRFPPQIKINFSDLANYTYSGLNAYGTNVLLNSLLKDPASIVVDLRRGIDSKLTYMKSMINLIELDLLDSGQIKQKGDDHPDTRQGYRTMKAFEDIKVKIATAFIANHKRYFDCAVRLQEIERRRVNRLYEEERAHLGAIFDKMRPLVKIKDKVLLNQEIAKINQDFFRNPKNGYRFDHLHGLTYRMSKYDLLMRMKRHIEEDKFTQLTEKEIKLYPHTNAEYVRDRNVTVIIPDGIERDAMVAQQTTNTVYVNGDSDAHRETFIREGMAAFSANMGAFITWDAQMRADTILKNYLDSLMEFYLLGPVTYSGKTYEISPEDLSSAFSRVYASYTLDEMDLKNAMDFKTDGRFERSFFTNVFFEQNGRQLPFFYYLMKEIRTRSGIALENATGSFAVRDAYRFAQTLINLRTFIFPPSAEVQDIIRENYGTRAHFVYDRVSQLLEHLTTKQKETKDVTELDRRFAHPFYLVEGKGVVWESSLSTVVDQIGLDDHQISIEEFTRRTGNFFHKQEKVKKD